jgi:hypothetical protein
MTRIGSSEQELVLYNSRVLQLDDPTMQQQAETYTNSFKSANDAVADDLNSF